MGLFYQLFCCCFRGRPDDSSIVDESSRLIPSSSEPEFTPPHVVIVDHQKMKERLGTIVRSKEGKMVNVNAHLPFDLYNQNPPSSSSRSASAQRQYSGNHFNSPRAHKAHTPVRRSTAGVNLGRPSQSRSQSSASASRNNSASRSSSSLYYNSIDSADGDAPTRHPTLNVKLVVNRPVVDGAGFLRKGRPKSRFGEPDPGDGGECETVDTSLASSHLTVCGGRGDGDGDTTPPRSFAAEAPIPRGDKTGESRDPEDVLTPTSSHTVSKLVNGQRPDTVAPDIEFRDVGDISRSWGA